MTATKTKYLIRWLVRRELSEVLAIDSAVADIPWTEDEWVALLQQRNCIAMSCEDGDRKIVGAILYTLQKSHLHLLRLIAGPQRAGVGTAMVQRLIDKLSQQRRTSITVEVPERLDGALAFFKLMGFRATRVERGVYHGDDLFVMRYSVAPERVPFVNRITPYLEADA